MEKNKKHTITLQNIVFFANNKQKVPKNNHNNPTRTSFDKKTRDDRHHHLGVKNEDEGGSRALQHGELLPLLRPALAIHQRDSISLSPSSTSRVARSHRFLCPIVSRKSTRFSAKIQRC